VSHPTHPKRLMTRILLLVALAPWGCAAPAVTPAPAPAPTVEWIAHRGESADAPENTMAAFRLAWERGVPTIELDVHLTADGELILSHDPNTRRTTGVDRVIRQSSLAELRGLDAGRWKGERWAGERMPTLGEVLATIPRAGRALIEIKEGPEAVPALVEAVRESGRAPGQLAVISFNLETVAEAKRRLPQIPAYYLSSFRQDEATGAWTPSVDELIRQARSVGADGLDLSFRGPIDREAVRRVKAAGLEFYVWTVDDLEVAQRMIAAGVDGITTNRAAWLAAEVDRVAAPAVPAPSP
jgi:glycerophosphoryl diester phosphodiesterase